MYWGFWIFFQLFCHCSDILDDVEISDQKLEEMQTLIRSFRAIPIITPQELNWKSP